MISNSTKTLVVVLKADKDIGTGHLMRVKAILPYLKNVTCYLVSDSISKELYQICDDFERIAVTTKDNLAHTALSFKPDVVLVDHYFLDKSFEASIYHQTKVVVIDDLVNRPHQCHMLFDAWVLRKPEEYKKLVNPQCELCVGSEYNYIRKEFSKIHKVENDTARPRVLVNFGGADPAHAVLMTTKTIVEHKLYEKFNFTIVAGISNHDFEKIKELVTGISSISLTKHTNNVPKLFSKIDLAIGAAGGMFSERNLAKIPSIVVEIADNQKGTCDFVKNYNIGIPLLLEELSDPNKLTVALQTLYTNKGIYERNCAKLYNSNGLQNVVDKIQGLIDHA